MSNTAEKERTSADSVEDISGSESGNESPLPARRDRRMQRSARRGGKSSSNLPLDQLPVSGVEATTDKALGGVTNTLGNVAGNAVENQQSDKGGGKSDTLRLRLDLNLDIEIQLKAKIHGDLELALLTG